MVAAELSVIFIITDNVLYVMFIMLQIAPVKDVEEPATIMRANVANDARQQRVMSPQFEQQFAASAGTSMHLAFSS